MGVERVSNRNINNNLIFFDTKRFAAANCTNHARAVPDVAMVADPGSGMYIYNSNGCNITKGCYTVVGISSSLLAFRLSLLHCNMPCTHIIVGGTSAASPIFAARAAVSGKIVNHAYIYADNIAFRDVIAGNNVNSGGFGYQCGVGYAYSLPLRYSFVTLL